MKRSLLAIVMLLSPVYSLIPQQQKLMEKQELKSFVSQLHQDAERWKVTVSLVDPR
jgi:hypothetical protein